ncbi:MAG TPA: FtsX-like permease family protein [Thermoleophilaceae bacterium]|nr:FtsX-like permease family protein [Thermoleophilaceae bacterium]
MLAVALKGLASRKLRAIATTLAVVLGVALVAGTYVLTDTINRSFDDIFDTALKGTDVVVTPKEIVSQETSEPPPFEASLVERVERVPGVEKAQGGIFSFGRITDAEGKPFGQGFAPQFISSATEKPFDTLTYVEGRAPRDATEVAVDASTADREGVDVGDRIGVVGERPLQRFTVVGTNKLGDTSTGGSASVTLTLAEAQRVTDKVGKLDQISIAAAPGVSPGELQRRVADVVPATTRVETGQQNAQRETDEIGSDLSFLKIALLVFAGISLVVGGFQIFNTFSITVAQRIREFGLLRTLGASRGQILGSVLLEASVIGLVGSVLGLLAGIGIASGLNALFKSFGIDLPNTGLVLESRTVIVSLVLGLGITLASAVTPALRATRVTPMAALLEAALPESRRRGRITAAVAGLLGIGGLAMLLIGLFGDLESSSSAASLMGAGSAAILFSASLYSPKLVRPLASVAGWPLERLRGLTGRLARENAMRKPGRTAVTSAALMIGLALVVFVTVFAAGLNRSIASAIDTNFQGDITIQNTDGFSPIPPSIGREVARVEGVGEVGSIRYSYAKLAGQKGQQRIAGVDPANIDDVFNFEFTEGSPATIARMSGGQAVVDEAYAKSRDLAVGDRLSVLTPTGKRAAFEIVGQVKDRTDFLGSFVITQAAMAREFGERRDSYVLVAVAGGADAAVVQRRIERLVDARYPSAEALDQEQLKQSQEDQIGALVGLIYALLSLAIVVSIFGIVNTLALSIHERTRELGMLRAVGMTRRQVRRVIRYEAVITAMIGALLGAALGLLFAALISRPLADEGFELAYPVGQLLLILVLAALAGVLAAVGPARRASKLDVLEALAYE